MEFFNPQMEQGSWEELIPTICFDGEIPHSNYTDLKDDTWKSLAACTYHYNHSSLNYEILADALHTSMEEDNDLGIYLNERPFTPTPQEVATVNTSSDVTNVSPTSSLSSGIYSCSDFEALSPPSYENPSSPEPYTAPYASHDNVSHYQDIDVYTPYHTNNDVERMTISQRLLSYAVPRTNMHHAIPAPIQQGPSDWQSQGHTLSLPMTTAKALSKPPESYIALISKAILSMPPRKALLSDIYSFALVNYEYYRTANKTWKNAIRHNLSINECFIKNGRAPQGRGFYWSIHPACLPSFLKGDFRRREARQLAVDMDKLRKETTEKHSAHHYV